jgi:hypothetical protein
MNFFLVIGLLLGSQLSYASSLPSYKTDLDTVKKERAVGGERIKKYNNQQKLAIYTGVLFLASGCVLSRIAGKMITQGVANSDTTTVLGGASIGLCAGAMALMSANLIVDAHVFDNSHDIYRRKGK